MTSGARKPPLNKVESTGLISKQNIETLDQTNSGRNLSGPGYDRRIVTPSFVNQRTLSLSLVLRKVNRIH